MQSYPLHTHNVVLFLVSSWKQTFGVRRVVSVADRTWENIDLTFSSLWVRHSILITSTFGNFYDDSLHLGIITYLSDWARSIDLSSRGIRWRHGLLSWISASLTRRTVVTATGTGPTNHVSSTSDWFYLFPPLLWVCLREVIAYLSYLIDFIAWLLLLIGFILSSILILTT